MSKLPDIYPNIEVFLRKQRQYRQFRGRFEFGAIDNPLFAENRSVLSLSIVHDQNGWVREAGTRECALPSYTRKVCCGILKGS